MISPAAVRGLELRRLADLRNSGEATRSCSSGVQLPPRARSSRPDALQGALEGRTFLSARPRRHLEPVRDWAAWRAGGGVSSSRPRPPRCGFHAAASAQNTEAPRGGPGRGSAAVQPLLRDVGVNQREAVWSAGAGPARQSPTRRPPACVAAVTVGRGLAVCVCVCVTEEALRLGSLHSSSGTCSSFYRIGGQGQRRGGWLGA